MTPWRFPLALWLVAAVSLTHLAPAAPPAEAEPAADPAKLDADYAIQGEYAGELETDKWGAQIIAQGEGKFQIVGYPGGLPGDGWDGNRETLARGQGELKDGVATFASADGRFSATVDKKGLTIREEGRIEIGTLPKVGRKSPTLGAAVPAGGVALFDGKSLDAWKPGAKIVADGLLAQGATTKQEFQNFTLHLEFRTPWKPKARGQERGNSGVYMQGRYEVQVLDSFGLEGKDNEAGGIYSVGGPSVNICFPPLQWQTYDVEFTAAKFDPAGKKTANARMTVRHNGVLVQDNVEVDHATTAAPLPEGSQPGPIHLQDHGNPVRYRNVWILPK